MLYTDFLANVRSAKSDGAPNEAVEMAVRSYTGGKLVSYVKPNGKKDMYVSFKADNGKRRSVTVEIKTACGNIEDCEACQYVAYWAEPDPYADVEYSVVIFSREEWHAFLNGYTGRGSLIRNAKDGRHIQSFRGINSGARPKASLPLANYIYEACEAQPTLAEWLESLRG